MPYQGCHVDTHTHTCKTGDRQGRDAPLSSQNTSSHNTHTDTRILPAPRPRLALPPNPQVTLDPLHIQAARVGVTHVCETPPPLMPQHATRLFLDLPCSCTQCNIWHVKPTGLLPAALDTRSLHRFQHAARMPTMGGLQTKLLQHSAASPHTQTAPVKHACAQLHTDTDNTSGVNLQQPQV